ncbi:hypothetical protein HU200_045319 [Digitaria exilis]|uniref:Uncharacterized protein n=1 Tax=Digitaria exilis TaxID=1010633 RepID=A0A835B339_9POAL|nr:hypothetical protein HU200_045319 [Digitaria exilis]CAB3498947.1 unnamed protein product [Digitaria exilis]
MEAAPDAKPGRGSPPVPPNYVSLRQLQELRLKEKEEQERRRREEEEAAAAAAAAKREAALKAEQERRRREEEEAAEAAAAATKRGAEKATMAVAIKREAALKAEAKGRAGSWEASFGAKERHRGGRAQGQGNQWVAVPHRVPATTLEPMARGQGVAGKRGAAIGGGDVEKGPDDVPANAARGGGKPLVKRKGKGRRRGREKLREGALASAHGGNPGEVVPASSNGGKPENKSESTAKGKGPGDEAAESSSRGGPGEPAEAAISSSRNCSRHREVIHAYARSAETCTDIAMAKAAGPSPERGVKPDGMEKPKAPAPRRADAVAGSEKPPAPRRADALAGSDSPDGKKAAPAQAPRTSAADISSKPTSGGSDGGLVEGQRWRPVVEAQAVAELNPRVARCSAGPLSSQRNLAVEQRGRVWVPKAAGAAARSSAGDGL